ncbi:MAG: hypothetical protein OIF57_08695 [Marinobacterium sp.]|nr:hypothetical protein [Marinobacterium sp.]
MAGIKAHGLQLVGNSVIKNLNVEMLPEDPSALGSGRIWGNSDAGTLNFSTTDGDGDVVVHSLGTKAEIDAIAALVNTINGNTETEGSFRHEVARIVGAAPETLDTLAEIAAALNNDENLHDTLVNLVNQSIQDLDQKVLGTATEAMDTLGEVQEAVGLEALETTSQTLRGAINEILQLAGEGTGQLKQSINDQRYSFASATPAAEHTITHNLNSEMLQPMVWVQDPDTGKLKNDIVSIEYVDLDTLKVELGEAANVRVTVQNLAEIA